MSALSRSDEIAVLEGVERITASAAFGAGERLPAMLRWLVREELAGRGDRIKGFSIATEVLGRGQGFDPQSDSIARAEMGRLRKALELHYATEGRGEPVRIVIPRGSYRPAITIAPLVEDERTTDIRPAVAARSRGYGSLVVILGAMLAIALGLGGVIFGALRNHPVAPEGSRVAGASPSLLIQSVTAEPDNPTAVATAEGLKAELASRLAETHWLTVILPPEEIAPPAGLAPDRYALDLRIAYADGRYTVRTFLKRVADNAVRWAQTYQGDYLHRETAALIEEVARTITGDLGRPGGVIEREEAVRVTGGAAEAEREFNCRLIARRYWRSYEPRLRIEAEACVRAVLTETPGSPTARAVLALIEIENARSLAGADRASRLDEAARLLAPLDADGSLPLTARLALAACKGDRAGMLDAAAQLQTRFPNDPAILADVGSKLGLAAGEWRRGLEAEARALALTPYPDPWYPLATAVRALADRQPAAALAALDRSPQRGFVTGHLVLLSAGGLLQDRMIIERTRAVLARTGLATSDNIRARLAGECWSDEAKAAVKAGLDAAAP